VNAEYGTNMWGIVENLGLKEGLAEFKEQFNKDAKATIANTSFAKERGIDVACLNAWENNLQKQVHENTIKRAVDTLKQDDTIAHLLDLRSSAQEDDDIGWDDEEDTEKSWKVSGETDALPPPTEPAGTVEPAGNNTAGTNVQVAPAERSLGHTSAADLSTIPVCKASASRALEAPPISTVQTVAALQKVPVDEEPTGGGDTSQVISPSYVVPSSGSTTSESKTSSSSNAAKVRELTASKTALEAQLTAAKNHSTELEGRLAEMSAVSDDALQQAEEARQQAKMLRKAVEDKDACIVSLEKQQQELGKAKSDMESKLQDLEASFNDRLQQEVIEKEQQLHEEVEYLRKSADIKEKRLQEVVAEKNQFERRLGERDVEAAGGHGGREAMLEAHTAIAKAFGDSSGQHPCMRLLDEPMLKFTAVLFKQPLFRRVFFFASLVLWVFAIRYAISPQGGYTIHDR